MRKTLLGLASAAALVAATAAASAQGTVKVGVIMTLSGQFADAGIQMRNGVQTYMKQFGDTVAGKKIELIIKDSGGMAPDVAKRLAQELVVRDGVDILAGFVLTPNALAAGDVSAEAKKLMVVMNAATSIVTTKSPYMVRSSVTLPQVAETLGAWAATKGGVKKVYTMVTDYGPGHDFEAAFQRAFKEAGGEVIGQVRFPVANPDFSAFIQRAKDLNPESIMAFVPGGAQPAAAQGYPASPIRMLIGFPPGGAVDIIGRMLAQKLGHADKARAALREGGLAPGEEGRVRGVDGRGSLLG